MLTPKQLYDLFGFYEKSRFFEIHNEWASGVTCVHRRPGIPFMEAGIIIKPLPRNDECYVELNRYKIGGIRVFAGKCETCGKVYYTTNKSREWGN